MLAIFDPECDSATISSVLGACGINQRFGNSNQSTTASFRDTIKEIKKANGTAIAAHVNCHNGLLKDVTNFRPELEKSLEELDGLEFKGNINHKNTELKKAIDQIAQVSGSDAHNLDEIGKSYSWIKMSKPNIENLRLSLLDHQISVKNQSEDPNVLPDIYLNKLTIKSMKHCGRENDKPFVIVLILILIH